ncbi:helix-hairpin-helix domain-containing protein [Marinoscillum sp. MHG1-6]|uniref:ComEA family DNA-binding protein n=1 Tax=Marinoscillum sp. MHG1-6 TaxID=2959627 RepID=UPI002157A85D|nr:helix-hairpin-helix domain-containing protein [Marinoscillum sp. MHG1-6]
MKHIKSWLIAHFGLSRGEMNGMFVLLFIILSIAILPRIYIHRYASTPLIPPSEREEFLSWAHKIEQSIQRKTFPIQQKNKEYDKKILASYKKTEYRDEDNRANKRLSEVSNSYESERDSYTQATIEMKSFDLNVATSEELMRIKGVGPVLSERIVKYRNRLGGFNQPDQLYEVYGLKHEVADSIKKWTYIRGKVTPTIPLNADSIKHIMTHPYINYSLAKHIFNYRKVHGRYKDIEELLSLKLMTDSLYQKLYPYLSLED